ncbi:MAG: YciI family protein [Flavobacterium sp.]
MKYILVIIAILATSLTFGQSNKSDKDALNSNPNYDKSLADKLGGDDYGMKSYFLIILKKGTNTTTDKEFIGKSFRGHMENINRLVDEGKLIVAGPLGKNENNYRGIFILNNIKTIEEAKELLQTDLAIKNGLLDYEIFSWYGSAALPEYLPFSDKIWKSRP